MTPISGPTLDCNICHRIAQSRKLYHSLPTFSRSKLQIIAKLLLTDLPSLIRHSPSNCSCYVLYSFFVHVHTCSTLRVLYQDNRSDNCEDFLWTKNIKRKSRRLSAPFSVRLPSTQCAINNALLFVDVYLLIQISSALVCRVCCHVRWNASVFLYERNGRHLPYTDICTLVTRCKKWHTRAAHWNVDASNLVSDACACRTLKCTR